MFLTHEQTLARLLIVAIHKLGGSLEVTPEVLEHMEKYNIVWNHREDLAYITVTTTSNEILIATVDNETVEVVL
jgi:hypothetical protein